MIPLYTGDGYLGGLHSAVGAVGCRTGRHPVLLRPGGDILRPERDGADARIGRWRCSSCVF